ncbi:MAG TPA: cytochrome c biogenesis protein DipZ, partial [Gaiellaceae bacterium]|nr:cytochrome c biogenesis protein DipZ [Gaiellaceae bacterium]
MLLLLLIGFVAGVITAISPCVLPVLPILLASGASGRKPLRVIAGLVTSFSVFTLFATWILDKLGLPQDTLRNLAIAFLFVLAAILLVPQAALIVERPLAVFSRFRPKGADGGGFFFGTTLGLVFVPCAGPVLATVTVVAANNNVGLRAILLTLAYAAGAAVPMVAIAFGGREAAAHLRSHAQTVRRVSGALVAAVAFGLVFHVDDHLATLTPGYTSFLQNKVEDNSTAKRELAKVRGGGTALAAKPHTTVGGLPDYGQAPPLHADGAWINSPPLTLAQLRGKVVLIDFWTYSCINCLRTLPHLKSWYSTYHDKGLVIIGVHTPEFAFEHVTSNVRAAVKRLGIAYPVVQDNRYKTWDNYANQYWPAEYLIDKQGHVRHTHFGEGEYDQTEALIRRLLNDNGAHARHVADATPSGLLTPESYLGYARLTNYAGAAAFPASGAPTRCSTPGRKRSTTCTPRPFGPGA